DGKLYLWDANPFNSELSIRRNALDLVRYLYGQHLNEDEVVSRIRRDQTISEEVRQVALDMAGLHGRSLLMEEAHQRVHALFSKPLFRQEVLQALQNDTSLPARLRQQSLELARAYPEQPGRLRDHSLDATLPPWASPEQYQRALEEAQGACRL